VQPAWGSMAVMVTPGQASKTFKFADGSCSAGEGDLALFNASFEVKANGDVSFKAATEANATGTERFSFALSDSKNRETRISAYEGAVNYIDYSMSNRNDYGYFFGSKSSESTPYKSVSFYAGEGNELRLDDHSLENDFYEIRCDVDEDSVEGNEPITVANLTPAVMPSEERAGVTFFKGATDVVLDQYNDFERPRIMGGELVWYFEGAPLMEEGEPEVPAYPAYSVNLSNGQWSEGFRRAFAGLLSTPAPKRVLFSGLLASGEYREVFNAESENFPESKLLVVEIYSEDDKYLEITRLGSSLYIGDYFDDEYDD
jgi:hypothetical protein